ncbi:MAG TPA: NUDIX domain-containing protein, partial [Hyphomicrobium sp.]|nr:NUDIX domain-containing protein [Hyphomicrobium sp.]
AMMDLGAEICTPKKPSCLVCPVQQDCAASAHNLAELLPMKGAKAARPSRFGVAFLVQREDGAVLLRQRPEAGLLGGMLEVPSTAWGDALPTKPQAMRSAPVSASWMPVPGAVVHVFTHFRLELVVYRALVPLDTGFTLWAEPERCRWVPRRDLHGQALPSVMRKVIAHGLADN